jgi:hypothetical protein
MDYYSGPKKSKGLALGNGGSVATCCAACNANKAGDWKWFTFRANIRSTKAFDTEGGSHVDTEPGMEGGVTAPNCWCHPATVERKKAAKGYTSGSCSRSDPHPSPPTTGPVVYYDGADLVAAAKAATAAEVAIVVLAQSSHENADRNTTNLNQAELVAGAPPSEPSLRSHLVPSVQ